MTAPVLLGIEGLTVTYGEGRGALKAVDDVDLEVRRGEALGLVGESGCGKTTLANAIVRLLPENGHSAARSVRLAGADITHLDDESFRRDVRWKRISMVFQGAMNALNPVETVGRQMGRLLRLHDSAAASTNVKSRVVDLLSRVGLEPSAADRYPHELSGGMRQRVIIAMSLIAEPELIIADEATTALDVVVQARILAGLRELQRDRALAMIVVSHDMDVVANLCDRIAVMYAGRIVEVGATSAVLDRPQHPYTAALLASLPRLTGPRRRLTTLPGSPPALASSMTGCRFAPRCPLATDRCTAVEPGLAEAPSGSSARCHYAGDPRIASAWGAPA